MLNYLWAGMIIVGIVFAVVTGKVSQVTVAALESSKEAVTLCITMMGVMAFWVGIMEIAKDAGIIEAAERKLGPLLSFLFPDIPKRHPARKHIAVNMIANFFGLGWAATPAGLKAMEELRNASEHPPGVASNAMCNFLILNIASLQLIPINVIAYRSQYGSTKPTAIIGPALVATFIGFGIAIIFCKWMSWRTR